MDANEKKELVGAVLAALNPPAEKPVEVMTTEELRAALAQYARGSQSAELRHPDAPGCTGLSDKARDEAATLYGASIMKKEAGQITPDEKVFLKASIAATLKDLGY